MDRDERPAGDDERVPAGAAFVTLLGILKSGAAYVPLDSTLPDERLQYMVKESGAEILRLWVAMSDYREEIRVGKEILARRVGQNELNAIQVVRAIGDAARAKGHGLDVGRVRLFAARGHGDHGEARRGATAVAVGLQVVDEERQGVVHQLHALGAAAERHRQFVAGIAQGLGMALMEAYVPGRTENLLAAAPVRGHRGRIAFPVRGVCPRTGPPPGNAGASGLAL